jgi:hypothetical protein
MKLALILKLSAVICNIIVTFTVAQLFPPVVASNMFSSLALLNLLYGLVLNPFYRGILVDFSVSQTRLNCFFVVILLFFGFASTLVVLKSEVVVFHILAVMPLFFARGIVSSYLRAREKVFAGNFDGMIARPLIMFLVCLYFFHYDNYDRSVIIMIYAIALAPLPITVCLIYRYRDFFFFKRFFDLSRLRYFKDFFGVASADSVVNNFILSILPLFNLAHFVVEVRILYLFKNFTYTFVSAMNILVPVKFAKANKEFESRLYQISRLNFILMIPLLFLFTMFIDQLKIILPVVEHVHLYATMTLCLLALFFVHHIYLVEKWIAARELNALRVWLFLLVLCETVGVLVCGYYGAREIIFTTIVVSPFVSLFFVQRLNICQVRTNETPG